MKFNIGLGFGLSSPLSLLLGQNPGAVRAADYTTNLYYSSSPKSLTGFLTDARATEIVLPDASGNLVTKYGERTNKCENYNANPTDLTGVTKSGDAAATLTLVDDTAALAAAGLSGLATSGQVYKLDNSAGVAYSYAYPDGATGNTNDHVFSSYVRGGEGELRASGGEGITAFSASSTYVRRTSSFTPGASTRKGGVVAYPGEVVYFILNDLEEGSKVTPTIVVAGAAATVAPEISRTTKGLGVYGAADCRTKRTSDLSDTSDWVSYSSFTMAVATSIVPGEVAYKHTGKNVSSEQRVQEQTGTAGVNNASVIIEEVDAAIIDFGLRHTAGSVWLGVARYTWATDSLVESIATVTNLEREVLQAVGPNGGKVVRLSCDIDSGAVTDLSFRIYANGIPANTSSTIIHHAQTTTGAGYKGIVVAGTSLVTRDATEPKGVQGRGPELVASPNFEYPADWTEGDGWTANVGYADCDGTQPGSANLYQSSVLSDVGTLVEATFTVSNYVSGSVRPYVGGGGQGTYVSADGTYSEQVVVASNTDAYIQGSSTFVGRITNVSFKQVTPYDGWVEETLGPELVVNGEMDTDTDWDKGVNWSIAAGVASFTGVGVDTLRQDIGLVTGITYSLTYTISGRTTGALQPVFGGDANGVNQTADGTYTDTVQSGTNNLIYFQPTSGFDGSIDNVSVKEVITTQTYKFVWDADSVTGDRSLGSVVDNADTGNRVELHFVSGILRLESYDGGVSQGFVTASGVDDGGAHSVVISWDTATTTISLKVDGGSVDTDATVTIPTTLNEIRPGWGPASYAQGFITQEFAAPGDMTGVWS